VDLQDYPMLHQADLMLALLKVAQERDASLADVMARLHRDCVKANEPWPCDESALLPLLAVVRDHLLVAGLLVEAQCPDHLRITPRGRAVLGQNPGGVDDSVLLQFPEFRAYIQSQRKAGRAEECGSGAFDEGWEAFRSGASHDDNPYRPDRLEHQDWQNGFFEARGELIPYGHWQELRS